MSPRIKIPSDEHLAAFRQFAAVLNDPSLSPAQSEKAWQWASDECHARVSSLTDERQRKHERRTFLAKQKANNGE